jgi:4-amino-4-deoxy-L-arabinose transferase-like glycosyltransferase
VNPQTAQTPCKAEALDRRWPRLGLAAIVLLALALRLWGLDRGGYGSEYFAAGVRSMMASWHNFFYAAFDPAGFVSLDKPPVAFWIQVISAKLFGFNGLSLLVPQAVEGTAAILLVHHLVRRRFGAAAGLLGALFLAVTPISVAVDRSGITDSCLVLVLLLAAWALIVAAEQGRLGLLLLSMALVAVGFNVKMLAALVVVPTFALVYFVGAPIAWPRRLAHLTFAGVVLAGVSLSWATAFDLTPADSRPFAGGSQGNSMLELALRYNGIERFIQRATRRAANPAVAAPEALPGPRIAAYDDVPVGPLRLADRHLAGQMAWFLPLAIFGIFGASRIGGAGSRLSLLLWSGWAITYGIVYSAAGGIFHAYYLVTMAPPLAALAGIGVTSLWSGRDRTGWRGLLLPTALLATAAWHAYIEYAYLGPDLDDWRGWLYAALLAGTAASLAGLLLSRRAATRQASSPGLAPAALAVGLAALIATPTAWALSSVLVTRNGLVPAADLSILARGGDHSLPRLAAWFALPTENPKLVEFLLANRNGERFLLATPNARQAGPIIIRTGEPVMALGGYLGTDPIITPEGLARLVADGQVRFLVVGAAGSFGRAPGSEMRRRAWIAWARKNGRPVDPALWQADTAAPSEPAARSAPSPTPRVQLYDLRPTPAPSM